MIRKITIKGRNARYEECRSADVEYNEEREINMEGEGVVYSEHIYSSAGQQQQNEGCRPYDGVRHMVRLPAPDGSSASEMIIDLDALFALKTIVDVDAASATEATTGADATPATEATSDMDAVVKSLMPLFFNNEDDVRLFLQHINGMVPGDVTDLVNTWVRERRISSYGNSRKGVLWEILSEAGLYTKSRQNWNRRVY